MAKKNTYNPKSRQDLSAKYHATPYNELLKLANVKKFSSPPKVETLKNGRIVVKKGKK